MRPLLLAFSLFLAAPASATLPQPKPAAVSIHPSVEDQLLADQRAELRRQARMELARRAAERGDILAWGKALCPDKFTLPFCHELHDYFVEIRGEEFTDTEAPRNHAKTTIKCFLIPLYQAVVEPETFQHYLNVQATKEKALAVNLSIRHELEANEELRELYGDQVGIDKWTDAQFVLKNGVVFTAIGAGQSIRGINFRNRRPDYINADDLYDEDDINNPDATIKKNDWFWGSLYPARAKSRRCSIHVQGTAINAEDLLEQLKGKPGVVSKTFKAITDWDRKTVLWVELNTFASLEQDRERMGSVIFFREMQNERRDETSSIIKSSWLAKWEIDPSTLKFDDHHFIEEISLNVDPSIGKTAENDPTAAILLYKNAYDDGDGHDYVIMGAWEEHLSLDKRVLLVKEINEEQPEDRQIAVTNIEGIGAFQDFASEVIRRTDLAVNVIDHVKDKISNLENKSHYFENGKVKISTAIPKKLRDRIKHQLTTNHPKNDDLRDALLLGIEDNSGEGGIFNA